MRHEDSPTEINGKLFPTDLPASEWVEFAAAGFSKPVCGAIYRFDQPATNGLALGGIDTGHAIRPARGLSGGGFPSGAG